MRFSGGLFASRAGILQEDDEEEDDEKGVKEHLDHGNDHNAQDEDEE